MVASDRNDDRQGGWLPSAPFDYSMRDLQPLDLDGISRVHWRACRVAYRFMSWSYSEDDVRRWYAGKLEAWDWGHVVCAGDAIVAYLAAVGAHIDQLFVDPDHQRAGIGTALLGAMLERRLRRQRCTCSRGTRRPVSSTSGSASGRPTPGGMRRIGPSICSTSSNSAAGREYLLGQGWRYALSSTIGICCQACSR